MRMLLICLVAAAAVPAVAVAADKPNFVFVFSDDVNRDSWALYGNPDCKTPNIDRIAAEGMRFDRAYCTVAMCAPFRQELYSGRTPWRTGTLANHSKSVSGTKSLPHYLKPAGYRVALLGKSHVGPREAYPFENLGGKGGNDGFVAATEKFIASCQKESKPFCLFVASNDGHAPFTTGDPSKYPPDKLKVPSYWLDTPELRATLSKYYAEVTNFDALVGRTRELLEKKGLLEKTVFMVCSEQGIQLPFAKWTCFDNGLHIGLVVRYPKLVNAGGVADQLISLADVAPTFCELAGAKLAEGDVDGKSFVSVLKGQPGEINEYVYGAFTNCRIIDNRQRVYPIRSIRDKRYTLIYSPNYKSVTSNVTLTQALNMLGTDAKAEGKGNGKGEIAGSWAARRNDDKRAAFLVNRLFRHEEFELFDRDADPHEEKNLAGDPAHAETLARLKKAIMARLESLGDSDPIATETKLAGGGKKKPQKKKK